LEPIDDDDAAGDEIDEGFGAVPRRVFAGAFAVGAPRTATATGWCSS
tara:strand:- start:109 stop:249 length:141 start_codon:yes stop_codon:yes gene_type:complete